VRYLNSGSFSTAAAASGPRDGELLCSLILEGMKERKAVHTPSSKVYECNSPGVGAGCVSLTGRRPVLLLTMTGRRSGQIPLFFLRNGDDLVVCNVRPPSERPNPWPLNIRTNPDDPCGSKMARSCVSAKKRS
jgi:hypothetical protein